MDVQRSLPQACGQRACGFLRTRGSAVWAGALSPAPHWAQTFSPDAAVYGSEQGLTALVPKVQPVSVWSQPGGSRDGFVLRHAELKLSCPYFCSWKTRTVKVMGILLSGPRWLQTPCLSHYFISGWESRPRAAAASLVCLSFLHLLEAVSEP